MEKGITLEELQQLNIKLASADFMTVDPQVATLGDAGKLQKICQIYKPIKTVIGLILFLPIIPANVKTAVKTLLSLLDSLCEV